MCPSSASRWSAPSPKGRLGVAIIRQIETLCQGKALVKQFTMLYNNTSNKKLTKYSQKLRREMTKEEKHLWYDCLKSLPVPFKRQYVINDYIVDFCCESKKLIVELDGSQHRENISQELKDIKRDKALSKLGYKIMRFDNIEINRNFNSVCDMILEYIYKH